jgi:glycogen(starch) synthase
MADADAGTTRRRVVQLVDNGVIGDSRVQKAARSAAEAGWDVTLLGRAPDGKRTSWQLGDAEVRLLKVPLVQGRRPHEFRRSLRAPLAYPPNNVGAHRAERVRAWKADIQFRQALRRTGAGHTGAVRGAVLEAQWFTARLYGRWISLRRSELTRAQQARRPLTSPVDRFYTWFWQRVMGDRAWRRLEPELWDYEIGYGKAIDALEPDLIHAHDFRMLGVGARAVARAREQGRTVKLVWDAHEFLPGVKPWRDNARWLPGNTAHEREYAPYADAVITVSDDLAGLLQQTHGLDRRPSVVLNAPDADDATPAGEHTPAPDLRALCGVGEDTPLIVYSGAAAVQRGLDIMVQALPQLPGAHVALVVNRGDGPYVTSLVERAAALGVGDRVHVLPYVPHWQVVSMLSGADVGVIPIHHWPNHEIALITKFFEYSHARLPLVVSDVRTMAATVRATGQGEVFTAEDVADYVHAVRAVLAEPDRYRAAYDKPGLLDGWTWRAQASVLDTVYRGLLGVPPSAVPAGRPASPYPMVMTSAPEAAG